MLSAILRCLGWYEPVHSYTVINEKTRALNQSEPSILSAIRQCLGLRKREPTPPCFTISEKEPYVDEPIDVNVTADDFVTTLMKAQKIDYKLVSELRVLTMRSWDMNQARAIMNKLTRNVRHVMEDKTVVAGPALQSVLEESAAAAQGFDKHPPCWFELVSTGIVARIAPWIPHLLGFGEFGLIELSSAHIWQRHYQKHVPKRELFLFLQHNGMQLKWYSD